jgi:hypothetical protein
VEVELHKIEGNGVELNDTFMEVEWRKTSEALIF